MLMILNLKVRKEFPEEMTFELTQEYIVVNQVKRSVKDEKELSKAKEHYRRRALFNGPN